ncbi:hypothetical protein AAA799E16_01573 [Marine Group I thaumarchaeote SCGC AAA799-E16]|uniref:Uncharacterized protein n=4 Tax=Marine Group I TaxID=905826 RepID=A0A087S8C6_9ARCH|nr:hypothetical protein AAA799N04_01468 [Marine Group I thaumarchaeote SCGC AAA799-N04]KER05742.1 hypothetical protein AAA799E16_01573 [Marine Group I thaumarchaeote SCGC AAA799-E16]KFM18101.1 hypothetical protein SCCGRSA3_01336 [Marine Group I thaumarchaeote SCGC RSA3]KFM21980.1 hypothetical protein AAA799B03_00427 [Marine Group I thaumarchaeote SCGC AAA799-B03]
MNTKAILGISFAAVFAVTMMFAPYVAAAGSHLDIKSVNVETDGSFANVEIKTKETIPVGVGSFGYGVITAFEGGFPENVLALTTHVCAADSPVQGNVDELGPDGVFGTADDVCPFAPEGSIGVLEFLRDNFPDQFGSLPQGEIDQLLDGPEMHPHILDLVATATLPVGEQACLGVDNFSGLEVDVVRTVTTANNVSPADYLLQVDNKKITVGNIPIDGSNLLSDEMIAYASFNIAPINNGENITHLCLTDLDLTLAE